MTVMQYKDFEGSADIDLDTLVCRGKILFIDDLVTYKANSPSELVQEFQAAVDDYLETCTQLGKTPQKPCKGQFNVRVTSELHRLAQRRAIQDGISLNAVAISALEDYLKVPVKEVIIVHEIYPEMAEASHSPWTNVVSLHGSLTQKNYIPPANLQPQDASGSLISNVNIRSNLEQQYAQ
jgi:predicted HicB family RNase H-like nuclease